MSEGGGGGGAAAEDQKGRGHKHRTSIVATHLPVHDFHRIPGTRLYDVSYKYSVQ